MGCGFQAISMQLGGGGWGRLEKRIRMELNFAAKTKDVTFSTSAKIKRIR